MILSYIEYIEGIEWRLVALALSENLTYQKANEYLSEIYSSFLQARNYSSELKSNERYKKRLGQAVEKYNLLLCMAVLKQSFMLVELCDSKLCVVSLMEASELLKAVIASVQRVENLYLQAVIYKGLEKTRPYYGYAESIKKLQNRVSDLFFRPQEQEQRTVERAARLISNLTNFSQNQSELGLSLGRFKNKQPNTRLRICGMFSGENVHPETVTRSDNTENKAYSPLGHEHF